MISNDQKLKSDQVNYLTKADNMKDIKQLYYKNEVKEQSSKQTQTSKLVSFQCMICLNEFNDNIHQPMLICINQHNMCKQCVDNKNFKKSFFIDSVIRQQKNGQFCPLCNEQIEINKIRNNNLLLQIYAWIKQVSKRQTQTIQRLQSQFEQVYTEYKKNIANFTQKNQRLISCIEILSKQNQILKKSFQINSIEQFNLNIDEDKLIKQYENLVLQLKDKTKQRKIKKQTKVIKKVKYNFQIDTSHKHFQKFKLHSKNCIQMQGPFYRSIFQSLNFFYNVMSTKGIKQQDFKKQQNLVYKYQFEIQQSKKGHIYVGLCCKQTATQINSFLKSDFLGFSVQHYQMVHKGNRYPLQKLKNQPKLWRSVLWKGFKIEIQVNKQHTVCKVNQQTVFECQTKTLFTIIKNQQVFPIISMQYVGNKVKINQQIQ